MRDPAFLRLLNDRNFPVFGWAIPEIALSSLLQEKRVR